MSAYNEVGQVYDTIIAMGKALRSGPMHAQDLRVAVLEHDGYPNLIPDAAKLMRRGGLVIYASKRGKDSTWYTLGTTPDQVSEWVKRIAHEHYSQVVDTARSLRYMVGAEDAREQAVQMAIEAGRYCGVYNPVRVRHLCEPVPLGYDPFAE